MLSRKIKGPLVGETSGPKEGVMAAANREQIYGMCPRTSTMRISIDDAQAVYQADQIGGARAEIVRFTVGEDLPSAKGMEYGNWIDLVKQKVQVYES